MGFWEFRQLGWPPGGAPSFIFYAPHETLFDSFSTSIRCDPQARLSHYSNPRFEDAEIDVLAESAFRVMMSLTHGAAQRRAQS